MGGGEPSSPVLPAPPLREGAPRAAISASSSRQVKRHKDLYADPQIGYLPHQLLPVITLFSGCFCPLPKLAFSFPIFIGGGGAGADRYSGAPVGRKALSYFSPGHSWRGEGRSAGFIKARC